MEALDLCVSCKGCKRECPTGVDMARMKIEFMSRYQAKHGFSLRDRAIAYLPRYAPWAARVSGVANLATSAFAPLLGFSARRPLPQWRGDYFVEPTSPKRGEREVVLFIDTFSRWFEAENARAAIRVLEAAGYRVHTAAPVTQGRPLCCGRTFLSAGMVDEAKLEAQRTLDALKPWVERGVPIIGLEPSCLFTFRDEFAAMLGAGPTQALAQRAYLFEEFLAAEADAGRLALKLKPLGKTALLHGHCHQKAFGAMPAVEKALKLVPGLAVQTIESSCCGMAGSFGYEAEHYDASMKMGELALLPGARQAAADALLVADGTSCRQQIAHGAAREARHVARVLADALAE
jgi:Fe-S oxidoreductase